MTAELVPRGATPEMVVPENMREAHAAAWAYARDSIARNTQIAYQKDWAAWICWCKENDLPSLPTKAICIAWYASKLADAGKSWSTIDRCVSGILFVHQAAGHTDAYRKHPDLRPVLRGIARNARQPKRKDALLPSHMRKLIAATEPGAAGMRDRAMLLVWWAGAFRRSEVVGINLEDVSEQHEGFLIMLHKTKTDQVGAGYPIGIPYSSDSRMCPVRALRTWIEALEYHGYVSGPLFRRLDGAYHVLPERLSDHGAARMVKRYAQRAGMNPKTVSGHSLRSGFVTTMTLLDRPAQKIATQTRHRSLNTLLDYVRVADAVRDNPASGGLDSKY